ncbi:hypothetical protein P152DRAFT_40280 [Eremomyces bilateralis CBS 781.70]|uniref:Uncharacterized protein n=1 Tax=Eremomyces bilateralis CBS 781.70 TaxID=1392243 RepID=A0A6G1G1Q3_9PEZI|nr:uncharacterized protein P152DRAFT_40280 [Eremomyces bilateralis CBS 781.70]KAF1811984.1 hypothetical protein P152DRAFT_40280 [Eremomyces bilateralis CBS 781.70]
MYFSSLVSLHECMIDGRVELHRTRRGLCVCIDPGFREPTERCSCVGDGDKVDWVMEFENAGKKQIDGDTSTGTNPAREVIEVEARDTTRRTSGYLDNHNYRYQRQILWRIDISDYDVRCFNRRKAIHLRGKEVTNFARRVCRQLKAVLDSNRPQNSETK